MNETTAKYIQDNTQRLVRHRMRAYGMFLSQPDTDDLIADCVANITSAVLDGKIETIPELRAYSWRVACSQIALLVRSRKAEKLLGEHDETVVDNRLYWASRLDWDDCVEHYLPEITPDDKQPQAKHLPEYVWSLLGEDLELCKIASMIARYGSTADAWQAARESGYPKSTFYSKVKVIKERLAILGE